jgi:hypothetical protein
MRGVPGPNRHASAGWHLRTRSLGRVGSAPWGPALFTRRDPSLRWDDGVGRCAHRALGPVRHASAGWHLGTRGLGRVGSAPSRPGLFTRGDPSLRWDDGLGRRRSIQVQGPDARSVPLARSVMPAQAGISGRGVSGARGALHGGRRSSPAGIPACAGMTVLVGRPVDCVGAEPRLVRRGQKKGRSRRTDPGKFWRGCLKGTIFLGPARLLCKCEEIRYECTKRTQRSADLRHILHRNGLVALHNQRLRGR